jgi:Ca-activated chloride channel family protein
MRLSLGEKRHVLGMVAALLGAALAGCGESAYSSKDSSGNGGPSPSDPGGASKPPQTSGSGGSTGSSSPGGAAGAFGTPGSPSPTPAGSGGSSATGGAPGGFNPAPGANTNVSLGGAQDFGYFRRLLGANQVPRTTDFDAAGFFAEHHTKLPPPVCGQRVCLQAMLAVMGNLASGASCTMLQLGLNSTLVADPSMRPPLNLAVSIDVSGSMNTGGKIDFVRAGLESLIDGLRDGDKVAIITYSDAVTVRFPMAEVSLKRAELRTLVRGLQAAGGTALHDGLKGAFLESQRSFESGRQNRVILLSDGNPTVGITGTPDILAMSKSYNSEGIGLTTIGLGTDFNPTLMRGLAQQADGNFYFLENTGAVKEVFTQELSYFTVPVVLDLKLELAAGAQYNFGRAYGSSFWKDLGLTGGRLEVPSVFLAHRQSAADQTPEGGRRGGGSALLIELMPKRSSDDGSGLTAADVAVVKVSFKEPGTNRIVTDQVTVNYPRAPWFTPEQGFFQSSDVTIVQKSFVMLNLYLAIEDACKNFWGGDRTQIIGNLRRLRAAVVDYNEEIKDEDITADLALLDQFMNVLRANGVRDPADVRIPANPWPAD